MINYLFRCKQTMNHFFVYLFKKLFKPRFSLFLFHLNINVYILLRHQTEKDIFTIIIISFKKCAAGVIHHAKGFALAAPEQTF